MSVYNADGTVLNALKQYDGGALGVAYNMDGVQIFPDAQPLPIPSGTLTADTIVPLPDLYETGKGFTCTGLAYDEENDLYLVGDIGILRPGSGTIQSQIVKLSYDFSTVLGTIPLYTAFPNMGGVQGITIDTTDRSIWFCAPSENKVHHISASGTDLGSFTLNGATGISYDKVTDTLWAVTYGQKIYNLTKSGSVISSYTWDNTDTMDQCFIDAVRGLLYFDAGDNYSGANYLYVYDTAQQSVSVSCTLTDSYSVEGISLESDRLVVLNDGYYHSATTAVNQANIYLLGT